jgi:hypothetical protein
MLILLVNSEFDDCIFEECAAWTLGGGIYIEFWGNQNFTRCIFTQCKAEIVFHFFITVFIIF